MPELDHIRKWYLEERGITPQTLELLGVQIDPANDEARWKVADRWKIRTGFKPGAERKFRYDRKGEFKPWFLPVKQLPVRGPIVACEGETDAMALWQAGREKYGMIVALPGVDTYTAKVAASIEKHANGQPTYFVLDNDPTGGYEGPQVEAAWSRIKKFSPRARRLALPAGYKDVCQYLEIYSFDDFDQGVLKAEAHYHYEALDFNKPSTDITWLCHGLIPQHQFGMIQGNGGVGKSWINLGLAVAIAMRQETFLGLELNIDKGRAMIVDKENPPEQTLLRAKQLGLTPEARKNLRIVTYGVTLDSHPQKLIEDVGTFDPDYLGLDSWIRLQEAELTQATPTAAIVNKAILPISRDLKVAVMLLHHVNRSAGGAQSRTLGGETLANSTDVAWDFSEQYIEGAGTVKVLKRFRTRIGHVKQRVKFRIEDTADGGIEFALLDDKIGEVM